MNKHKKAPSAATLEALDNVINFEVDHMSNANKKVTQMQSRPTRYCEPEEALQALDITSLDQIHDALSCAVNRTSGLAGLLFAAVESNDICQDTMLSSVWLLQGQLEMMSLLLRTPEQGRARA